MIFWVYLGKYKISINLILPLLFFTLLNVAPGKFLIAYVAHMCGLNSILFPLDSAVHPAHIPKWSTLPHPLQPAQSQEASGAQGPRGCQGNLLQGWDKER